MSRTEVRHCSCPNTGQDALYGINRRVHNLCTKGWRCTCCTTITGSPTVVATKGGKK